MGEEDQGYSEDDANNAMDEHWYEREERDDNDIITVRATDWLDLGTEQCRQLACDNIAALVDWQLNTQGEQL